MSDITEKSAEDSKINESADKSGYSPDDSASDHVTPEKKMPVMRHETVISEYAVKSNLRAKSTAGSTNRKLLPILSEYSRSPAFSDLVSLNGVGSQLSR